MQRYTAFLGGINVGGHRVTGPELIAAFEELGYDDVATFLASGNVVFTADDRPDAARIAAHMADALGYGVPTYLRSREEVCRIAAHEPFPEGQVAASAGKLQVGLLADAPAADARAVVAGLSTDQDRLVLDGSELWWLPSGGISDSDLEFKAVTAATGPMTMRTANTVRRIATKFFDAQRR